MVQTMGKMFNSKLKHIPVNPLTSKLELQEFLDLQQRGQDKRYEDRATVLHLGASLYMLPKPHQQTSISRIPATGFLLVFEIKLCQKAEMKGMLGGMG